MSNYPDGFDHDLLDEEPEPEETEETEEEDFDADDLADSDDDYDPQERMVWDGREEP